MDNGKTIGKLSAGGVLSFQRPPGRMELSLVPSFMAVDRLEPLRVDVAAGRVYRFTVEVIEKRGSLATDATLALRPVPTGATPQEGASVLPTIPAAQRTPHTFNGFAIAPPQSTGWQRGAFRPDRAMFAKRAALNRHGVILGVERSPVTRTFRTPEEYLSYVRASYFLADPKYTEFLASEADLNDRYGEFCVKYYYKHKETRKKHPPDVPYVVHEGHCYVCLHPESTNYEFDICRSEEYVVGEEDPRLHAEEADFIERFAFTNLVGEGSIFLLQQVHTTFFRLRVELDGEEIAQLSKCGEVITVESEAGEHTLSAFYGGAGRIDIFNKPERPFEMPPGKSSYFVIKQADDMGKFIPNITIVEVTERDWLAREAAGAGAPGCRGYFRE